MLAGAAVTRSDFKVKRIVVTLAKVKQKSKLFSRAVATRVKAGGHPPRTGVCSLVSSC